MQVIPLFCSHHNIMVELILLFEVRRSHSDGSGVTNPLIIQHLTFLFLKPQSFQQKSRQKKFEFSWILSFSSKFVCVWVLNVDGMIACLQTMTLQHLSVILPPPPPTKIWRFTDFVVRYTFFCQEEKNKLQLWVIGILRNFYRRIYN